MPSTSWIPVVSNIADGDSVSSEVVNPIFNSYTARTQHLLEKINELEDKSSLIAQLQTVATASGVSDYSVVYFDPITNNNKGLKLSKVAVAYDEDIKQFKASNSTFTFGIVKSVSGDKATVWLQGLIKSTGLLVQLLDATTANTSVAGGPLYLSNITPGKLTTAPTGLSIYVGYALGPDEILLNPSFDIVNDFFLTYRFPILDRPAGSPQFATSSSSWAFNSVDATKVGWIPAANAPISAPNYPTFSAGSVFFYNLPNDVAIDADSSLSIDEKLSSKQLRKFFPPSARGVTMLFVNGQMQLARESGVLDNVLPNSCPSGNKYDGLYYVDNTGLWWYSNKEDKQPWAKDIQSGFSTPNQWSVNDWCAWKGSATYRPRMTLVFTTLNPSLKQNVVTSLKPYFKTSVNDSSKAIQLLDSADQQAITGDLFIRYKLPVTGASAPPTPAAVAIKNVEYNEVSGDLQVQRTPVISSIVGVGGIKATTNTETGECTLLSGPFTGPVLINSIEPENARLELTGLNTYLTFGYNNLPCGLLGKILLPSNLPNASIKISFVIIGKALVSGKPKLKLNFQYNVMPIGGLLSQGVTTMPTRVYEFPTAQMYTPFTAVTHSNLTFEILNSELSPGGILNFRLQRPKIVDQDEYLNDVAVVAAYWSF